MLDVWNIVRPRMSWLAKHLPCHGAMLLICLRDVNQNLTQKGLMCKLFRHIAPVSQPNWPRKIADFPRLRYGGTNDAKRLATRPGAGDTPRLRRHPGPPLSIAPLLKVNLTPNLACIPVEKASTFQRHQVRRPTPTQSTSWLIVRPRPQRAMVSKYVTCPACSYANHNSNNNLSNGAGIAFFCQAQQLAARDMQNPRRNPR